MSSTMIQRNIGNAERVVRLLLAVLLFGWVINGAAVGAPQVTALIAAFALLWNSIFARCYLWKWVGISTCPERGGNCDQPECGGPEGGAGERGA